MSKTIFAADLFCGAGGESTGMMQAAHDLGLKVDLLAVNHWEMAIETHSRNHPDARHLCESIQNVHPTQAVPGGKLALLWASPECTHHSVARGGRPCSDQSRASAWLLLKWLSELYVERVIIENVPEFISWGPLGKDGRPIQSRRGEVFESWVSALRALGYKVDWRVLRAADYGDPTTRRRLFVQAVRGSKKIVWPQPTHSEQPEIFNQSPWVAAREIIDWSLTGQSISDRKKPLADATLARIEAGIKKYWGEWAEPFLVVLRGTGTVRDLNVPLPAITAGGLHLGLVQPFLTKFHGGNPNRNHSIDEPIPTLDTSNRFGLVEPFIYASGHRSSVRIQSISAPLSTVVTKAEHCLIEPFLVQYYGNGEARSINSPLDTVTCRDRFALVEGTPYSLDIRFRMLQPHELAGAQGFPKKYWFAGNKSEQVKQIGNAVPCGLARALCREILSA
jgi:DNA (cytosine-5)-methyltransferase 1